MSRRKSKVLTDKNQNEYINQDNQEVSPSSNVFQEIDMMTISENHFSDLEVSSTGFKGRKQASKISMLQIENENMHFYKSASEIAGSKNRDEFVLFKRRQPPPQPLGENYFSKLSDEIMLHIFQMLPKSTIIRCCLVSKRWRELCYDETIWKRYDFGKRIIKPFTLEILLKRRNSILRLAMSEFRSPVFSSDYLNVYPWRANLQYLDLSMTVIKTEDLSSLLSKCYLLKKLSVEHCILNEECCLNIAENGQLEVLNMAMCEGITPGGLHAICICCQKLKEWNLGWCQLSEDTVESCFHCFPSTIRRLNLSGHREVLTDAALIKVIKKCRQLRELDVSDNANITNTSIEVLIKQCPNLQHLHTSRSYNIPTETNKLLRGLKNFRNLEIFQTLTDTALAALRSYLPDVKINQHMFSTVARPTVGIRRTSIWEIPTRDV